MEEDENDILFTNTFIKAPELEPSIKSRLSSSEYNKEFQDYYTSQDDPIVKRQSQQLSGGIGTGDGSTNRYQRFIKTLVSIDSRNRDTILYPKPSNFKIFLGRTFYNVRTVRIVTMEFPNTNAVINSTNNKVYWINQEDIDLDIIDTATQNYPIYNTELRIGSYIASKLEVELETKFRQVKRKNKIGEYHYFATTLDIETDVVTFVSLIVTQLGLNPLTTLAGTGLMKVTAPAHGYVTGETIYMIGSRVISGISSEFINQPHVITVLNADTFTYEITEKAITTDDGGGSNIRTGKLAPFQLLFGDYPMTIAKNIGYLYENSSSQIILNIKSMDNFYQVGINIDGRHFLTRENSINTTVIVSGSGTTPATDGTKVISDIPSSTSVVVNVGSLLDIQSFNQGTIDIDGTIYNITSISNITSKTVLVETFHNHNYAINDIGKSIKMYSTISKPSFDGDNAITMILDETKIVLIGEILTGGNVNVATPGLGGYTPLHEPITTEYHTIVGFVPGTVSTITVDTPHILKVGDSIKIYNIDTAPSLVLAGGVHTVFSIINNTTFTIDTPTTSVSTDLTLLETFLGTSTVTLNFPQHGFNTITSITNNTPGTDILIQTLLPHGFTTGDTMRISKSNATPNVDNGGYVITVISADTFTVPLLFPLAIDGTYGVVGMSMDFSLYRVESLSGISQDKLNGIKFTVRDVIDENNFTFNVTGYYSNSKVSGGGTGLFINSLLHGFNGVQTNTKNGLIDRSISLEGENYTFLTCPQLGTMRNTGDVSDIFARITLDQSPGMMVFNFLSNPKEFDTAPLNSLEELEFSMVNFDNTFYEFNDLDYSMTIEIIETIDTNYAFNISSRRGITDTLN